MIILQILNKIRNEIILTGKDKRYKIEAYSFVLQGLNLYYIKTGEKRQFSGNELVYGLIDFAQKQFGPLAFSVLKYWGINSTDDLGYIVYNLIDLNLIRKQESDSIEDFFNVFNISDYLVKTEKTSFDKSYVKCIKGA
jgi:uncharacterized repeat protein (TIGR04138 family)